MEEYFKSIQDGLDEAYERAREARSRGLDPKEEPEIPLAEDIAARVEKLTGPEGVAEAIRELEKDCSREDLSFKIAEMIVEDEFGHLSDEEAAEQTIRTCLAIITEGVAAAAPIEGITQVKIKNNFDGSPYLAIYFAGPIRSAGGTAAALAVLYGDFVRRKLNLTPYDPSDKEVERMVEEVNMYEASAGLQYSGSDEEVRNAYSNLPVEVSGEPTEQESVTANRDLERVETNRVRGGAVLAIAEGVLQKAPKILKHLDNLGLSGWEWLRDLKGSSKDEDEEEEKNYPKGDKYLGNIIAGRPVFGHPARPGGFRLRYGRARNTGLAAGGIHPATMRILDDHTSTGTQLKTERPGKAVAVTPVDSVEGPTVKLEGGSVVRVDSESRAMDLRDRVEEIISLGDLLIGYGEFLENNHPLMPAGYCQEWWAQEVEEVLDEGEIEEDLGSYTRPPFESPGPELALKISKELGAPLHPDYTYNFHDLEVEELGELGEWLASGEAEFDDGVLRGVRAGLEEGPKRILESLGVPHFVEDGEVVLEDAALPLCACLDLIEDGSLSSENLESFVEENMNKKPIDLLESLAGFPIRKKSPTRIGARMGRPEKAKPREMSPPVHVLFPVGWAGGSTRNIDKAADKGSVELEVANRECPDCGRSTLKIKCPDCGSRTEVVRYCPSCDRPSENEECMKCGSETIPYREREVEIDSLLEEASDRVGEPVPGMLKGVKGMTSAWKLPEPLEKGILRAQNDVYVFKDGTVRFDATDLPLTHFRPNEIGTSVERLRELGYEEDYKGEPLESGDQLLELRVQDVLLSEPAADYFLNSAGFVDDLLEKFYDVPPFYEASEKEDLVGHLVIGLAPHTSAGITGRIIGFSEANVGYAHPYFHAAKRRNCDSDEDALMLLLDALLNFSEDYLPESRGGSMDAPLVLTPKLIPAEIDDEAHNLDVDPSYPVEFYEATLSFEEPEEVLSEIGIVEDRLETEAEYHDLAFNEAHEVTTISAGPSACRYKSLGPMEEKTDSQMTLARMIRAVDESDVVERLIENHFIPDLKGNLRAFSRQEFRCASCNTKYRRVPLSGRCENCGEDLILTVTKGGVKKYLDVAMRVAEEYKATEYTKQRLGLVQEEIGSVFESDIKEQLSLADFA